MKPGSVTILASFHPWTYAEVDYYGEHLKIQTGVNAQNYTRVVYVQGPVSPVFLPVYNQSEQVLPSIIEVKKYGIGPVPEEDDNFAGLSGGPQKDAFYSLKVSLPPGLLALIDRPGPLYVVVNLTVENRDTTVPSGNALGNDPRPTVTLDVGSWLKNALLTTATYTHGVRAWRYKIILAGIAALVPSATMKVRWDFPSIKVPSGKFGLEVEVDITYTPAFYDADYVRDKSLRSRDSSFTLDSSIDQLSDLDE